MRKVHKFLSHIGVQIGQSVKNTVVPSQLKIEAHFSEHENGVWIKSKDLPYDEFIGMSNIQHVWLEKEKDE